MIQYNTIEEFNVDSKAECDQLNLAHKSFYILFYACSCLIQTGVESHAYWIVTI